MQRRTSSAMRFLHRRRKRRLDTLALLLIELEQLATDGRGGRRRATLRF